MADVFDPYHKWLGILPKDQPPHHYRLLAIEPFESDPDVIEAAADRQMAHLRGYQTGSHSAHSQKLLNECAAARVTLLDAVKKAAYDRQLSEKLASVGNALRGVPGVAAVPRAKPLPQSQPSTDAAPLIDVGVSPPIALRSAHSRKKKPALTDGNTASSHDGFWLLSEKAPGWAEIDLAFAEPRTCSGVLERARACLPMTLRSGTRITASTMSAAPLS